MVEDSDDGSSRALAIWFEFFNEIGIAHQLSRTLFESRLPDGITVAHFSVLNHLIRVRDGQTPRALADAFQTPKTSMTHTIAGLESLGYVSVRSNPRDGRSKLVWLTEAGRQFRDHAIGLLRLDVARIAEQFDTELVAETTPVLAAIRQILDRSR